MCTGDPSSDLTLRSPDSVHRAHAPCIPPTRRCDGDCKRPLVNAQVRMSKPDSGLGLSHVSGKGLQTIQRFSLFPGAKTPANGRERTPRPGPALTRQTPIPPPLAHHPHLTSLHPQPAPHLLPTLNLHLPRRPNPALLPPDHPPPRIRPPPHHHHRGEGGGDPCILCADFASLDWGTPTSSPRASAARPVSSRGGGIGFQPKRGSIPTTQQWGGHGSSDGGGTPASRARARSGYSSRHSCFKRSRKVSLILFLTR